VIWGHSEWDLEVLEVVNYKGDSTEVDKEWTKVISDQIEARLSNKDSGQKDIDLETQLINRL